MSKRGKPRGPDFLIIGAPRAGTSWLYVVLRQHPALWLPPVKELHYFDKSARTRTWLDPYERRRVRPRALNLWHLSYLFGRRSDEWYAKLFHKAQLKGLIAGEATPDYAVLDADGFKRIQRMNPDIKLIFIMRDPVDRSWSAVNNAFKKGRVSRSLTEAAVEWARREGPMARSSYPETIRRLEGIFPRAQLHYCFFDDLAQRPADFVAAVLSFLDVEPTDSQMFPANAINAVVQGKPVPNEFARELARDLLPSVIDLCERFDGAPQKWRARYERLLNGRNAEPAQAPAIG